MENVREAESLNNLEVISMTDVLEVFGMDRHTFKNYAGDYQKVGRKRGIHKNGQRYFSLNDLSQLLNVDPEGLKVLMSAYFKRKKDIPEAHRILFDLSTKEG